MNEILARRGALSGLGVARHGKQIYPEVEEMNKRIKLLAEQANLITHKVPNGLAHLHTEQDVEKFAELIVEECIKVCQSRVGNSDYNTGRMHCVSDLKEHFGVEE